MALLSVASRVAQMVVHLVGTKAAKRVAQTGQRSVGTRAAPWAGSSVVSKVLRLAE